MLPEGLVGTSQRYKQNTTEFTTWLSKSALACGFNFAKLVAFDNVSAQPSAASKEEGVPKAPKLKGRARKLAREAAAAKEKEREKEAKSLEQEKGKCQITKYKVTSKELIAQAKLVVSSQSPRIDVPSTIIRVLKRAIEAR